MPWSEITPMDQRRRFIRDVQQARDDMTTLCARYRISRKSGYKWLSRYAAEGPPGLLPRSHRTRTTLDLTRGGNCAPRAATTPSDLGSEEAPRRARAP